MHVEVNRAPSLDELARCAGLSRAHFAREFAAHFGISPHQYLVRLRLDAAKRGLASGRHVTDVCFDLGIASLGTFSTAFRRRTGYTPRAWQQRARPFVQSHGIPRLYVPACYFAGFIAHV